MMKTLMATSAVWLSISAVAAAQTETLQPTPVEPAPIEAVEEEAPLSVPVAPDAPMSIDAEEDAITRQLNANQRLEQSFTLRRTVNGELVETTKRTVALPRGEQARAPNAGEKARQRVLEAYDGEVLSRLEALEEAKNDFNAADADQNGQMNESEFEALAERWRAEARRRQGPPVDEQESRQERYEAFLSELKRETDDTRPHTDAAKKFAFLAGASETISREDYVREYMLDFDAMDANKDMLLAGEELDQFRALIRGETTKM